MTFHDTRPVSSTPYLIQPVFQLIGDIGQGTRVLDVGCGNGYWSGQLRDRGCDVVGIDPSQSGIELARKAYPNVRFECITIDDLATLGESPFDIVVSTEVIEHLYSPSRYAANCFGALRPGGTLVLSTPYHGRLKDIALAVAGQMEFHHDALREGGHIKFFTRRTLERVLAAAGFGDFRFVGAGRLPYLWKSMVVSAKRP
jgi:2-polyprenyl-6-hydroxyphenyl methylase/3-demethylubiquinone-9 3-methyltransferase